MIRLNMSDDWDLTALRQRIAVEVVEANLAVLACQEQVAQSRQQLTEARALVAETQDRLARAYHTLE